MRLSSSLIVTSLRSVCVLLLREEGEAMAEAAGDLNRGPAEERRFSSGSNLSSARRSSGLLLRAPPGSSEADILCEALSRLSRVTRAIAGNLRNLNGSLERILLDKQDIDELENMLNNWIPK
ncbi:uncharacterized protein LOC135352604 [Latimeria chalumnae]|uniref:uncharacterized protein LOC135352604 n=1 Tax=Latimeria chalumnae TaxID=7897 RepID=UPI00313B5331